MHLGSTRPFGSDVNHGMVDLFTSKYRLQHKKAWHFDRCKKYIGSFKSSIPFSAEGATEPYNHQKDSCAVHYPALFFYDPSSGFWMVCLKMVIQISKSWQVHPTRIGPAYPCDDHDSDSDWVILK